MENPKTKPQAAPEVSEQKPFNDVLPAVPTGIELVEPPVVETAATAAAAVPTNTFDTATQGAPVRPVARVAKSPKPPKNNVDPPSPTIAIALATFMFILLAAAAYYAFTQSK